MEEGIRNRKKVMDSVAQVGVKKTQLTQVYKRKSRTIFTPEYIVRLHDWIENHSELITISPKIDDTVWVTDPITKARVRKQKMFYVSSVREMHNKMIQPVNQGGFDGARNEDGDVVISDTILRNSLPKNLRKMTDSHMQLCGCEVCIISKNLVPVLNKWCTVTYNSMMNEANKP